MAFGMYAASVPIYQHQLGAISKVLEKGSAWAAAKKVDEAVIMGTRMIPDMLPFSRQVSNRVYPTGRRHGAASDAAAVQEPSCPACGRNQRPLPRSSARFATAPRQTCLNPACGKALQLVGDRWALAEASGP